MPTLATRLTDTVAKNLPLPAEKYLIHWCPKTPGFGVRISATGDRAFIAERRVDGKTIRRTLGKCSGPAAITTAVARELQLTVSGELQKGIDRSAVKREALRIDRVEGLTLSSAIEQYVKGKVSKAGLHLKPRTKADYLAMIEGNLSTLANTPLNRITGEAIRKAHAGIKSERQATYAMQVLRAVLAWHGVTVPGSPLGRDAVGKTKILLPPTRGNPAPIPPEKIGAWWAAASAQAGNPGADALRLMLLTGCRPGEILGSKFEAGLLVRDVDLEGGRMTFADPKNRKEHVVMLSTQALAIVARHCEGKKASAKVFDLLAAPKTLKAINETADCKMVTPHKLRHTFASICSELCSNAALKAMLNHSTAGDVTAEHYVKLSESKLRAAWQSVADAVVESSPTA